MFEKEIEYGISLLEKSQLKRDVLDKAVGIRAWTNMYGNPTYSFYYKNKKAVLVDYYGTTTFKEPKQWVNRKKDL